MIFEVVVQKAVACLHTELGFHSNSQLEKKKAAAEQGNMPLSPRPGSSAGRVPSRRISGSFGNTSPTNRSVLGSPSSRRSSLGAQQTGWSSHNPETQGTPPMKVGTKSMRQIYAQSQYGSQPRDETASIVSTFSGPLSPDL